MTEGAPADTFHLSHLATLALVCYVCNSTTLKKKETDHNVINARQLVQNLTW